MPDVAKDVRMRTRTIEQHLSGRQHNHRFIRRIFSPEDLGERLRPFVFLDYIHGQIPDGGGFGFHPHSGIATVTFQQSIDIDYEDTTGQKGVVRARGIEYVQAGECLWHRASLRSNSEDSTGFQLWLSLPPELEEAPARAEYLPPEAVPQKDNVRVLLGEYQGARSPIVGPYPINYFWVSLEAGQTFSFVPPAGHEVAWAFAFGGVVDCSGLSTSEELLIFDREDGALLFVAKTPAQLMVASSPPHPYPLAIGWSSVHTSPEVLQRCEAKMADMGKELRRSGRIL